MSSNKNPGILLHACCAPCASPVIARLQSEGQVTVLFSNSNIYPIEEYVKRRDELLNYCTKENIPFAEDEYRHDLWLEAIKGYELEPEKGRRCSICFRFRLQRSAQWAQTQAPFDSFATTLTVSPHKNSSVIHTIGNEVASCEGIGFLAIDFTKQDGYKESLRISKEEGFYRQNYCGCQFSIRNAT